MSLAVVDEAHEASGAPRLSSRHLMLASFRSAPYRHFSRMLDHHSGDEYRVARARDSIVISRPRLTCHANIAAGRRRLLNAASRAWRVVDAARLRFHLLLNRRRGPLADLAALAFSTMSLRRLHEDAAFIIKVSAAEARGLWSRAVRAPAYEGAPLPAICAMSPRQSMRLADFRVTMSAGCAFLRILGRDRTEHSAH